MANIVVVGAQWGDEGKGKVVDLLAHRARWVVRFQGGNNAGHTLVVDGEQVILHLVPSGILQPGCTNVIGNGVVVDPAVLVAELEALAARGHAVGPDRLVVSTEAHLIMPWHKALDKAREAALDGEKKIGTTGRGIGPAYEDKVGRRGIRIGELLDAVVFRARVEEVLPDHNRRLVEWYGADPIDVDGVVAEVSAFASRLRPYARSTVGMLNAAVRRGESILFEGAQGTFLDVDHGTYPFVTSSSTVAGGACAGSGVGPTVIDEVVGIAKAYATRVGGGPFPTEDVGEIGARLREVGREYGATTGRPRRCGWFDAPMVRHAAMVNGLTRLAVTKLDILSGMGPLQICTAYRGLEEVPSGAVGLSRVECEYETTDGWDVDLAGCRRFSELPVAARRYVERIEELAGVPVALIGVGAGRDAVIVRDPMFG